MYHPKLLRVINMAHEMTPEVDTAIGQPCKLWLERVMKKLIQWLDESIYPLSF